MKEGKGWKIQGVAKRNKKAFFLVVVQLILLLTVQ